ncbi:MAG: hypothetical protein FJZ15_04715 [Candidatus Omnitrophica bacterium]|nr:hypothetical protein [Candidatus Omnitrophota bacterium]
MNYRNENIFRKPLGVKVFGIGNMIFSSTILIVYLPYFLFTVVFGILSDRELYGIIEWIYLAIINRINISVAFIFSFLLFLSGVFLLKGNVKARKLARISSMTIVLSSFIGIVSTISVQLIYPGKRLFGLNPWVYFDIIFLIYTFFLNTYLSRAPIKKLFPDENLKIIFIKGHNEQSVSFKKYIVLILISFFFPIPLWILHYIYTLFIKYFY